jgi:4-amino-4-deoxy-L-arabinose transferase-like glycosyltransferase
MRHPVVLIIAAWALLYLPGLGSRELQGEEARRVLPGRTMLQNGDFMLPRSGGQVYNRKPPLVNWMSAGAISLSGEMNEWTVRLPSALMVLALALTAYGCLRKWLDPRTAALTAFILLTNVGFIEKGRLIEIEALYFSLYGMAVIWWLGFWNTQRPLLAWIGCAVLSALAFLAKGPPHLIYLYLIIGCVLHAHGRLKELTRWPHLVSLAVFVGMWLPWVLLNMERNPYKDSTSEWTEQITHRLGLIEFSLTNYLLQIPQSLINFLPWALFIPLWFSRREGGHEKVLRAVAWGTVWGFLVIAVLPSSRPRFMLPCNVTAALLTAHALVQAGPEWIKKASKIWRWVAILMAAIATAVLVANLVHPVPGSSLPVVTLALVASAAAVIYLTVRRRHRQQSPLRLASYIVLALGSCSMAFHAVAVPLMLQREDLRPFAAEICAITGDKDKVVLYRVGERMWPFYLGMNCVEISTIRDRPRPTRWMITPLDLWEDAEKKQVLIEKMAAPLHIHQLTAPGDEQTKLVLLEFTLAPREGR